MTRTAVASHSPVEDVLRYAVAIGATLVLLVPAARGQSAVGWLPLWLLGMPLCAWACLRLAARLDASAAPVAAVRAPARPAALGRLPASGPRPRRRALPAARRRHVRAA